MRTSDNHTHRLTSFDDGASAEMSPKTPIDLNSCRIGVMVNRSSGSCDVQSEHDLGAILASRGLKASEIWCGQGGDLQAALAKMQNHLLDVLIVLGGDGTIRAAAESCHVDSPLLMPLAGGTMNVLPKALYGARSWRDALAATLEKPVRRSIAGGTVAGHRFFIAAIFGGATKIADAREALRSGAIAQAVEKGVGALGNALSTTLQYDFGLFSGSSEAVAVLCDTSRLSFSPTGMFEVAAFKLESPLAAVRLAVHSLLGGWRTDPDVVHTHLKTLAVSSELPIPAMLDGEMFAFGRAVQIDFLPTAFTALVPGP